MNIRQMIDTTSALALDSSNAGKTEFKTGDQVVVKKASGFGRRSISEVMAGTITAFADNNTQAVISIPRAGGQQLRTKVFVDQLQPVSEVFKRNRVQFNPAFRGSV
jgi:ABC-type taurine transport system ATPase subunit